MRDFCADGCQPVYGMYRNNVLERAISHTEIHQDRPPCGLDPNLPFGCLLKQQPIRINEAAHNALGPDTYGFTIYQALDVNFIRRWAEHFVLPAQHGWREEGRIRQDSFSSFVQ